MADPVIAAPGDDQPGQADAPRAKTKKQLTLHKASGQWCKKVHGKTHYFGTNYREAVAAWNRVSTRLTSGESAPVVDPNTLTLRELCSRHLLDYQSRITGGEVKERQYYDRRWHLQRFSKYIGPDRLAASIKTFELQGFRSSLINKRLAATTINNDMAAVKALFMWAWENDVLEKIPKLRAVKRVPRKEVDRQVFTGDEIRKLASRATPQLAAMIWLGVNCGFGCEDCGEVKWEHLDLEHPGVDFARTKTGVGRRFKLWPPTVEALQRLPRKGPYVFYTKQGNLFTSSRSQGKKGATNNPITKEFAKLLRKSGIPHQKGTGFYSLRRTGATMTAESGDIYAVQCFLGHKGITQAEHYVQKRKLQPQTDRAMEHNYTRVMESTTTPADSAPHPDAAAGAPPALPATGEARPPAARAG